LIIDQIVIKLKITELGLLKTYNLICYAFLEDITVTFAVSILQVHYIVNVKYRKSGLALLVKKIRVNWLLIKFKAEIII